MAYSTNLNVIQINAPTKKPCKYQSLFKIILEIYEVLHELQY